VSSVVKGKADGGLLNHSKLDVPAPDIQSPGIVEKRVERFSLLNNMFEKEPEFKMNRYIKEKEQKYKERKSRELKNKIEKPVELNNTLFQYNVEKPSIHITKDKKKKKKKKPVKFDILY
jgi:hypothetical protein